MHFVLKATNVKITPSMEVYIEDKLRKTTERLAGKSNAPSSKMVLEVGKPSRHHKKGEVWQAVATIFFGGKSLRAETSGETFRKAIDLLEGELSREVVAYKGKADAISKRKARKFKKELKLSLPTPLGIGTPTSNKNNKYVGAAAKTKSNGRVREEGI